jgi:hypothetical protein
METNKRRHRGKSSDSNKKICCAPHPALGQENMLGEIMSFLHGIQTWKHCMLVSKLWKRAATTAFGAKIANIREVLDLTYNRTTKLSPQDKFKLGQLMDHVPSNIYCVAVQIHMRVETAFRLHEKEALFNHSSVEDLRSELDHDIPCELIHPKGYFGTINECEYMTRSDNSRYLMHTLGSRIVELEAPTYDFTVDNICENPQYLPLFVLRKFIISSFERLNVRAILAEQLKEHRDLMFMISERLHLLADGNAIIDTYRDEIGATFAQVFSRINDVPNGSRYEEAMEASIK